MRRLIFPLPRFAYLQPSRRKSNLYNWTTKVNGLASNSDKNGADLDASMNSMLAG